MSFTDEEVSLSDPSVSRDIFGNPTGYTTVNDDTMKNISPGSVEWWKDNAVEDKSFPKRWHIVVALILLLALIIGISVGTTHGSIPCDKPITTSIDHQLTGTCHEDVTLTYSGDNFLIIAGAKMVVQDETNGIPLVYQDLKNCSSIKIRNLKNNYECKQGNYTLNRNSKFADNEISSIDTTLINPRCEKSKYELTLPVVKVPPPMITSVGPQVLCVSSSSSGSLYEFEIYGDNFVLMHDSDGNIASPTMNVNETISTDLTFEDCNWYNFSMNPYNSSQDISLQSCKKATGTVMLPSNEQQVVYFALGLSNPAPYDCSSALFNGFLDTIQRPTLSSVSPTLFCTDDRPQQIVLHGDGFLKIGDESAVVLVGGQEFPGLLENCLDVAGPPNLPPGTDVQSCTSISVQLPLGSLPSSSEHWTDYPISLRDPEPVFCDALPSNLFVSVPPEVVISNVDPEWVCSSETAPFQNPMRISGAGFPPNATIFMGSTNMTATVNRQDSQCNVKSDLDASGADRTCTELDLYFQPKFTEFGVLPLTIENPDSRFCSFTLEEGVGSVPPAQVTGLSKEQLCGATGGDLEVLGTGFTNYSSVYMELDVVGGDKLRIDPISQEVYNHTLIYATFPVLDTSGRYTLQVENVKGCENPSDYSLFITSIITAYFVDPPIIYSGEDTSIEIFVSGLTNYPKEVYFYGPAPLNNAINMTVLKTGQTSYGSINVFAAENSLKPGVYGVSFVDTYGCTSTILEKALKVVDTLGVNITSVTPETISNQTSSVLTIIGEGFEAIPFVYLMPTSRTLGVINLQTVTFVSENELQALIPAGITRPGMYYDLFVLNPNKEIGVLEGAVLVSDQDSPIINLVTPNALRTSTLTTLYIYGSGFKNTSKFRLDCDGGDSSDGANINTILSGTLVTGQFRVAGIANKCTMTVFNTNGANFIYKYVTITGSASHLRSFEETTPLIHARRGGELARVEPSPLSNYLFAFGGDQGGTDFDVPAPNNALTAVEISKIDFDGSVSEWREGEYPLPTPCVYGSHIVVSQYLYYTCGYDGAAEAASGRVFRTKVLTFDEAPMPVALIDLAKDGDEASIESGVYFYQVSAVFSNKSTINPNGESLVCFPLSINVPDVSGVIVSLIWDQLNGADYYKIFRTPNPGMQPSETEFMTTTSSADFVDYGNGTFQKADKLLVGSMANWYELETKLNTPRYQASMSALRNPDEQPDSTSPSVYLYVFGGLDKFGVALRTYEILPIKIEAGQLTENQIIGSRGWQFGPVNMPMATSGQRSLVITPGDDPAINDWQSWILNGASSTSSNMYMSKIIHPATGQLSFTNTMAAKYPGGGYTMRKSANFIYNTGGVQNYPSKGITQSYWTTAYPPPATGGFSFSGYSTLTGEYIWVASTDFTIYQYFIGGAETNKSATNQCSISFCCD